MNSKELNQIKRVAFLATGDEIVNGDILNTNSQAMAQLLFQQGINVGSHLIVSDEQIEIERSIQFLLQEHQALIITGGLGPTSDDRTRFALAEALGLPLEFDEATWERILERFRELNLKQQPESNRKQALFPKTASVIPNENGSASACWILDQEKLIFMLPGPPKECLPIFNNTVLPLLKKYNFSQKTIYKKWLLFGVSEGQIAEEMDALAAPYDITTGYRFSYPYVEFKVYSKSEEALEKFLSVAEGRIKKHLISESSIPATESLLKILENYNGTIYIDDQATQGALPEVLTTVRTHKKVIFSNLNDSNHGLTIKIEGLHELKNDSKDASTNWLSIQSGVYHKRYEFPYRGVRTAYYAVELICSTIIALLSKGKIKEIKGVIK